MDASLPSEGDYVFLLGPDGNNHNLTESWPIESIIIDEQSGWPIATFADKPYSTWPLEFCRRAHKVQ